MSITILATLVKPCKGDRLSSWTFFNDNGVYYSTNDQGKRINCVSVDELRSFYKNMVSYGFYQPKTITMVKDTPVPTETTSVVKVQPLIIPRPKVTGLNYPPVLSWC